MRILILLLTSMFLYSCGNKNSATDYDDYDLETPCGCAGYMHKVLEEADTASIERSSELEDLTADGFRKCKIVIAVFEKDEIKIHIKGGEGKTDPYMDVEPEAVEEAILNTDHFNGCEEAAIEISHRIAYAMDELLNEKYK